MPQHSAPAELCSPAGLPEHLQQPVPCLNDGSDPHISLWDCILPSARILPAKPVHPSGTWNIAGVLALLFRWLGYPLVDVLWVIQQKCSSSTSYCVYCTSQLGKREQEFLSHWAIIQQCNYPAESQKKNILCIVWLIPAVLGKKKLILKNTKTFSWVKKKTGHSRAYLHYTAAEREEIPTLVLQHISWFLVVIVSPADPRAGFHTLLKLELEVVHWACDGLRSFPQTC